MRRVDSDGPAFGMSPPGPLLSPTVCEIWKWIIIVTAVPVVLFRLSDIAFVWVGRGKWEVGGSRWNAWLAWVNRRMRLWWLGVGILVFATTVYAAHCR